MLTVFIPDLPADWEGQLRRIAADLTIQVQGKAYFVDVGAPGDLVTVQRGIGGDRAEALVEASVRRNGKPLLSYAEAAERLLASERGQAWAATLPIPSEMSFLAVGRRPKPSRPAHAGAVKLMLNKRRWWRGGSSRAPVA